MPPTPLVGTAPARPAPWAARHRRAVYALWAAIAIAAAPFALRVTHGLTATGFEAPHSAAVWADNASARMHPPASVPPTLVDRLSTARARALAAQAGADPAWFHPLDGGGGLFLPPATATPQARAFLSLVRARGGQTLDVTPSRIASELSQDSERTLHTASALAFPLLLILLVVVFGSFGSAALPLVIAALGAELALAVIDLLEARITLSIYLTDIATFLALGVGVDYALFISSRFRQALGQGRESGEVMRAVGEAMATAGRSVLFSGLAVALALSTLVLGATAYWRGLALGGAVAVLSVLAATHTLLPALLASLGPAVNWGRVLPPPKAGGVARRGMWERLSAWVTAAPVRSVALGVVLLGAPALFAPRIELRVPANLASMLPPSSRLRQASQLQQRIQGAGAIAPIVVALRLPTPVTAPATWRTVAAVTARLATLGDVASVASPATSSLPPAALAAAAQALAQAPDASLAPPSVRSLAAFVNPRALPRTVVLYVTARSGPNQAATRRLVDALPGRLRPLLPAQSRLAVGGTVALLHGFDRFTDRRLPWIIGAVAAVAVLVLTLATGSLTQALLGAALDGLVALATAGLLVLTVERGALGLEPQAPNMAVTPLIFVLLFGLSMDYEVILLHRMQEALAAGGRAADAAKEGVRATGGMITGAGLIMVTVFIVLLASPLEVLKTLAIGMSAAILLDTWVVRTFLVPATTALLGRWAFWPWGGRPR
ncbi:MAG: MMPL family transporter, partial [Firmicutes bacterium]|nr:MMPL family transporter [Bacillota bacterium]